MENVRLDPDNCLPPCSGLFVTSFSKFKPEEKLVAVFKPEAENYNKYKKITQNPPGFNGKITLKHEVFQLTDILLRMEKQFEVHKNFH